MALARKSPQAEQLPDDDELDSIAERAAQEMLEKHRGGEQAQTEERPDPREQVSVDEEDEEDEEEEVEQKPTARQRKSNRYRELQEQKAEAERRLRDVESERDRERLRAESLALLARQGQKPEKDELQAKQEALWEEKTNIYSTFESLTPEGRQANHQRMQERLRDIEFEMQELAARRAMRAHQPRQQSQGDLILATQFPDVASHPNGNRLTAVHYERLRLRGHADSPETLAMAAEAAREDIPELAGRNRGRQGLRERLSSTSSSTSVRGSSQAQQKRVIDFSGKDNLSKARREMAEAAFPDDEPHVAYKKWARKVGSKLKDL